MLRKLFASKSLIAALIVCGLVIVGIHLWSQHEHRKLRREEAATRRFIQQVESRQKASMTRTEEPDIFSPPQEVTNDVQAARSTSAPVPEAIPAPAAAVAVAESLEENWLAEEDAPAVEPPRMSLFGFGVYPEIPPDYPEQDAWDAIEALYLTDPEEARKHELMERVCIKLWQQGHYAEGVVYKSETGLIYPLYPNTAYIEWDVWEEEDGTLSRFPASVLGGPGVGGHEEDFAEGIIPPHITVIDYEEGGIDPYQFLDSLDE